MADVKAVVLARLTVAVSLLALALAYSELPVLADLWRTVATSATSLSVEESGSRNAPMPI
jgi:hypothetical protein